MIWRQPRFTRTYTRSPYTKLFRSGAVIGSLIAEHAERAFIQNVETVGLRQAVARGQRIREQRRRLAALVLHLLGDGEKVIVIEIDEDRKSTRLNSSH